MLAAALIADMFWKSAQRFSLRMDAVGLQEIGVKVVRKRPREISEGGGGRTRKPAKTPSPGHKAKEGKVKRVSEKSDQKAEKVASTTPGGARVPPEGGTGRGNGSAAPMEGQQRKMPAGTHGAPGAGADHPPAEARSSEPATEAGAGEGAEEGASAARPPAGSAKKTKMNGAMHAAPAAETRETILETRQQLPIFLARKEILFEMRCVRSWGDVGAVVLLWLMESV